MSTSLKWPSLTSAHPTAEDYNEQADNEIGQPLTWPAELERPAIAGAGYPHPNLFLQLSQILEWEIWGHSLTRNELWTVQNERIDLETHINRLTQDLAQWQAACQAAYAALDEHRTEHAALQKNMDTVTAELYRRQQYSPTAGESSAPWQGSASAESSKAQIDEIQALPTMKEEGTAWRLGFIRDIEEHVSTAE